MYKTSRRRALIARAIIPPLVPETYQAVEYIKTPSGNYTARAAIVPNVLNKDIGKAVINYTLITPTDTREIICCASQDLTRVTAYSPWASLTDTSYSISPSATGYITITPMLSRNDIHSNLAGTYTIKFNSDSRYYFRIGGTSAGNTGEGKYYQVIIYDTNDNIICNLIPCYRKSDNKVGMYDTVNQTFYPDIFEQTERDGFIAGPNIT